MFENDVGNIYSQLSHTGSQHSLIHIYIYIYIINEIVMITLGYNMCRFL